MEARAAMWVSPREVLVAGPFWATDRANPHFLLQCRKGRGKGKGKGAAADDGAGTMGGGGGGLSALLVGTWDAVMDTKPPTYRLGWRTTTLLGEFSLASF